MHQLASADLTRLRARTDDPAFAAAWDRVRRTADRALDSPLSPPRRGAGWTHEYFCPTHGTRLHYDPASPEAHRCRTGGEVFRGDPYDAAWRAHANNELVTGLRAASLVWLATGDERYVTHITTTLLAYTDRYARYRPHGRHAGKGRAMGQSLDEAVWAIPLAQAYDAVRDSLDAATREQLETKLLRRVGNHLEGQLWRRVHNIECWHLAGLATVGAVLDEDRFVAPALDPEYGLPGQLREGVLDDGWWYEGSASYHFYTMRAVVALAYALRRRVPELLDQPRLRRMFAAPLELVRADLTLPALNDGWPTVTRPPGIGEYVALYEQAWGLWRDPDHAEMLACIYGQPEGTAPKRDSVDALLFGPDTAELSGRGSAPVARSRCFAASGYAVLRDGTPDERWLLLKYGPHGGGHGHPDKLSLDLHAFGHRLSPDLGTSGYGVPTHRTWFRQTLSHNTVIIGESSQPPTAGELVTFGPPDDKVGVADAVVSWPDDEESGAYAGVGVRRCLLWRPGPGAYVLDVVLVRCLEPKPIDLAWHHLGALGTHADLESVRWEPADTTYALLHDVRRLPSRTWTAEWRLDDAPDVGTRAWGWDPDDAATLAARAPSNPPADDLAFLLRRVHAERARFGTVLEPFRGSAATRDVRWEPSPSGLRVVVDRADGTDTWTLHLDEAADSVGALRWNLER